MKEKMLVFHEKKKATEEDSKEKVTVGLKINGWEGDCLYANGYSRLVPIGPSGGYLANRLATSL